MKEKNFFKKISIIAAQTADSKKGKNIVIYELNENNSMFYFSLILTAESYPQIVAIEEEIQKKLKNEKIYILHKDGIQSRNWKIMDYGGLIIHIFEEETRKFYGLDKIYANCRKINWEKPLKTKTYTKKKKNGNKKS